MTETALIARGQSYVASNLSTATLTLFQTTLIPDPDLPNQETESFEATPTGQQVNLMKMGFQPMTDEAVEKAGLDSRSTYFACFCQPVSAVPEGRVRLANHPISVYDGDYRIESVEDWHGVYSKLILEVL